MYVLILSQSCDASSHTEALVRLELLAGNMNIYFPFTQNLYETVFTSYNLYSVTNLPPHSFPNFIFKNAFTTLARADLQ